MKRKILEYLVEPDTHEPLQLEAAGGDAVLEGTLRAGDNTYPVRDGIPSFVPAEKSSDQTVKSFAQKWDKHRYYRKHTEGFYTQWFLDRYGLENLDGLKSLLSDVKFALDAGTGSGRDAVVFARNSNATVFGVDTAWQALKVQSEDSDRPEVALVHADVNRLPFPDEFFDFISCDQVIHHTPDPPKTFLDLRQKLKTGGQICCYVYKKKAVIREFVDDYVRERIKDMPIDDALEVCEGITKLGHNLAKLDATLEIEEDIPILGIKKGQFNLQRWMHWNVMKCFWNDDFDFFTNNIVNVDWYHPVYCYRYTPEEFRAWFNEGWEILHWDVQDAGISCRAKKV